MTPDPDRARLGVSLTFLTNGALFSTLLPRYPEVKAAFELSNTAYGVVVIAAAIGSMMAAGLPALLIRRCGALKVATWGTFVLAGALAAAGFATSVWIFVAMMALAGFTDAAVDAGQNTHGMAVEHWKGRSVINSLHALWSLGATLGGLIGVWAGAAGVPLGWHLSLTGLLWSAVAVLAAWLGRVPAEVVRAAAPEEVQAGSPRRGPWLLLVPLAVLAICGTLVEDVSNNWATLYLNVVASAPLALAGLGYVVAFGSQFVGRLLGDPMTDRWGRDRVALLGGLLIAGGVLVVLTAVPWAALVGFGLIGFGSATLVPAAFAASSRISGFAQGTAITLLGWLMRLGFLATSPVIGAIADAASLRVAMVVPLVAGLVAAGISWSNGRGRVAA